MLGFPLAVQIRLAKLNPNGITTFIWYAAAPPSDLTGGIWICLGDPDSSSKDGIPYGITTSISDAAALQLQSDPTGGA